MMMVTINNWLFGSMKTGLCVCVCTVNPDWISNTFTLQPNLVNIIITRCLLELLSLCILWVLWMCVLENLSTLHWPGDIKKAEVALKSCMLQNRWLDAACFHLCRESLLTTRFYHLKFDLKDKPIQGQLVDIF